MILPFSVRTTEAPCSEIGTIHLQLPGEFREIQVLEPKRGTAAQGRSFRHRWTLVHLNPSFRRRPAAADHDGQTQRVSNPYFYLLTELLRAASSIRAATSFGWEM